MEELQPDLSTHTRRTVERDSYCLHSDMIARVNARGGGDMEVALAAGESFHRGIGGSGSGGGGDVWGHGGLASAKSDSATATIRGHYATGDSLPDLGQGVWTDRVGAAVPARDLLDDESVHSTHSAHSTADSRRPNHNPSRRDDAEGRVRVTACFRINPKIDFIPEWA